MTERVRGRWFFWSVVGLTALAAAIRFSTLGLQSYRHDEAVTAGRVLVASLAGTMHRVWTGESTPPLYYLLAWGWSHLFGVREVGLRSLSALFGVATVPVAALAGRELVGRRTGVAIAALVAVNPLLVWYSQDARAYALLVLFSTAALLFFLRARRSGSRRDLAWWAAFSALALATHYFAVFPIAIEAALLLLQARPLRRVVWALAAIAAAGLALSPIALHQAAGKNNSWIAASPLGGRLRAAGISFLAGEEALLKHAALPLVLCLAAVALLLWRGGERDKQGAALAAAIGVGAILLALLFVAFGQDFVLGRNLLPALIPLGLVAAIAIAAPRSGRLGLAVGVLLAGYWLAFCVYADFRPALQREDWRSVAAAIGPSKGRPRAIVAYAQGGEPLSFYLPRGQRQVQFKHWGEEAVPLAEVDVVSGRPPPRRHRSLPPSFRQVERRTVGRMTLLRYRAPAPVVLRWGQLIRNFTGYSGEVVLVDGPGSSRR
ncbi:MAG: glycosyltransferase family 39 protein [Solirubrobacterales bacterium]